MGTRPSATGTFFTRRALEAAGVPTLLVEADMVDARTWDGNAMRRKVSSFIEDHVQ